MACRFLDELLPYPGFIQTQHFDACNRFIRTEDVNAVIITGQGGSGKTLLSKELCVNFSHAHTRDRIIFKIFNCRDLQTFYGDLVQFYDQWKISSQNLVDQTQARDWHFLMRTLYMDVNAKQDFCTHYKLFIFDYVEKLPEFLEALNNLCWKLKDGSNESPHLWKMLVTSQRKPLAAKYRHIGNNFCRLEGFEEHEAVKLFQQSNVEATLAKKIFQTVGSLPLALDLCVKIMENNEMEYEEFVEEFFDRIKEEALALPVTDQPTSVQSNVLITIKLSISYLLRDVRNGEDSKELIKIITFFHEGYLTTELLISCAETVVAAPKQAQVLAQNLIRQMETRGLCSVQKEKEGKVISLNKLVMEAMSLFVDSELKARFMTKALIALTRVMPEDGRRHLNRFVRYYAEHGKKIDAEITKMDNAFVNKNDTPLILLLHSNVLARLVYCILSQRIDSENGSHRFKQALDKYCQLVDLPNYKALQLHPRDVAGSGVHRQIAEQLYAASQRLPMIRHDEYLDYVRKLPQYHRLTQKDIQMMKSSSDCTLVNEHVTEKQLEKFRGERKVIEANKLAPLFVAETLTLIYRMGFTRGYKIPGGDSGSNLIAEKDRVERAEAGVAVHDKIYKEHGVYLLTALITERELLLTKLQTADTVEDVESIRRKLEALKDVGSDPIKMWGFEAGVMKADLSKDEYHPMVCLQHTIICHGKLFQLTRQNSYYEQGKKLLTEVEELAKKQLYPKSACSYIYKVFADFLFHCQKFKDAVKYVVNAMNQLGLHLTREDPRGTGTGRAYLEFDHYRFQALYDDLKKYAENRLEEVMLDVGSAAYDYLSDAVENVGGANGQTSDGESRYPLLSELLRQ